MCQSCMGEGAQVVCLCLGVYVKAEKVGRCLIGGVFIG